MTATLASLVAIALYAAGMILRWRQIGPATNPPTPAQDAHGGPIMGITAIALLLHGVASYGYLVHPDGLDLSLLSVTNLVAFVLVGVVALASVRLPVENLFLFLFPVSIAALVAINALERTTVERITMTDALMMHVLISLAAYTTLMMAAMQSILLAVQERKLKTPSQAALRLLPPLETMEHLLVAMIWIGLLLLTASIASGYFFLDDMFAQQVVHHIVLTSLSWIVYVAFLLGRYRFGWRGQTAVRWTLVGFVLLLLGYFGSKFVMEYLLNR